MTQGKSDGKNPKFRILCKRCNSYVHTVFERYPEGLRISCYNCGNMAQDFDEEEA